MNRDPRVMRFGLAKVGGSAMFMGTLADYDPRAISADIAFRDYTCDGVPDCDDPDFYVSNAHKHPRMGESPYSPHVSPRQPEAWEAIEDAKDAELDAWIMGLGIWTAVNS